MTRSYSTILHEVGNAVDYVRSEGGSVPWDAVSEHIEVGEQLVDLPDNAVLEDWYSEELFPTLPNEVRAVNVEEFAMAYKALGRIHHGINRREVNRQIAHEIAHKANADFIGFRQSVFGLRITESIARRGIFGPTRFSWRPYAEQAGPISAVTKLSIASVVAAPRILSDGDAARLNAMGYEGQADVANRIMNATHSRLLLPESYRS